MENNIIWVWILGVKWVCFGCWATYVIVRSNREDNRKYERIKRSREEIEKQYEGMTPDECYRHWMVNYVSKLPSIHPLTNEMIREVEWGDG